MRAKLGVSVSGRYRLDENIYLTKHVVAAGSFAKDAGSTPAASTISCPCLARTFAGRPIGAPEPGATGEEPRKERTT